MFFQRYAAEHQPWTKKEVIFSLASPGKSTPSCSTCVPFLISRMILPDCPVANYVHFCKCVQAMCSKIGHLSITFLSKIGGGPCKVCIAWQGPTLGTKNTQQHKWTYLSSSKSSELQHIIQIHQHQWFHQLFPLVPRPDLSPEIRRLQIRLIFTKPSK